MSFRAPAASSAPVAARLRKAGSALCGLALLAVLLAPAQRSGGQAIERPGDERPELPEFEAPGEPEPSLPSLPTPARPREQLSAGPGFFVKGYRIEGSTVFSEQELQAAVAPWAGRVIHSEDLVAVRNALTQLYIDHGYVNSGAVLPDQDLEGGIVELRIIEGSLDEIRISGNQQFRDRYLRSRIGLGVTKPLDVRKLERRIQILQQDPRIRRVTARLAPGEQLGEAILYLDVEEASRFQADLRFSNYEPPSIGALAGQVEGAVESPTGWGDTLRARFTVSGGLQRYQGHYEIPVSPWDTLLSLDGLYAEAKIVESPFDVPDIESTFQSYKIGVRHPVYTSPRTRVELGLTGDWRRTKTMVEGESFSFPGSGAQDGKATAVVLRFLVDWLRRDQKQVFAARSQLSWGIDAPGVTINPGDDPNLPSWLPDGRFLAWLLQLQWARRFGPWGIEAIVRGDLQLASAPLLTMEQFAVGGYATVRGYRQNQRVQDQGVVGSVEVRVPIWRHPERWGVVQLAPFVDVGHTWNHPDRPESLAKTLVGVGVGLRWTLTRFLDARIYWGQNLTSVETSGNLQDKGVQFLLSGSFP